MRRRTVAAAFFLALPGAAAPPERADEPPAPPAAEESPGLLSGPRVQDEAADPESGGFGGPGRERPLAQRAMRFFRIVRDLDLTEAQRREVEAVLAEVARARRGFEEAHGGEARELERQVREARAAGGRPPEEVRRAMAALAGKRPRIAEYQDRIWAVLDERQREALRARLDEERRARGGGRGGAAGEAMEGTDGMDESGRPPAGAARRSGRTAPAAVGAPGLDETARRRLEFLRARQLERAAEPAPPAAREP